MSNQKAEVHHIPGYPIDKASSDVNELEYISSLLQSESCDIPLRDDASIAPVDIKRLLMSRYGLRISCERIERELFIELAGSSNYNDVVGDSNIWEDNDKTNIAGEIMTDDSNIDKSIKDHRKNTSVTFEEIINNCKEGDEGGSTSTHHRTPSLMRNSAQMVQTGVGATTSVATKTVTKVVSSIIPTSNTGRHTTVWFDIVQLVAILCIPELQRARYLEDNTTSNTNVGRSFRRRIQAQHQKHAKELPNTKVLKDLNEDCGDIVDAALKILLSFSGVESISTSIDENDVSSLTMELNPDNLRQMLSSLEEDNDDISDEFINEMIYVAKTGQILRSTSEDSSTEIESTVMLNHTTFLNALTADIATAINSNVLPYEDQSTTHYEDAIRKVKYKNNKSNTGTSTIGGAGQDSNELYDNNYKNVEVVTQLAVELGEPSSRNDVKISMNESTKTSNDTPWYKNLTKTTVSTIQETTTLVAKDGSIHDPDLNRKWTAPSIDMAVDTFKSYWWTVIMWFTIVILFFSYFVSDNFFSVNSRLPSIDCSAEVRLTEFACKCMKGVVIWINVFVQLAVLGTSFIVLSSFGNSIYRYRTRYIEVGMSLVGIIVITFTTILAYRYSVKTALFTTEKSNDKIAGQYLYAGSVVLGVFLLLIQIVNLLRILLTSDTLEKITKAVPLFAESSRKLERNTKCAAAYKMRRMINNALTCHIYTENDDDDDFEPNDANKIESKSKSTKLKSLESFQKKSMPVILSKNWQGSLSEALYQYEVQSHRSTFYPASLTNARVWYELFITRRLGYLEGVWIYPRLIASSLAQWSVFVIAPFIWIFGISFAKSNAEVLEEYGISVWEVQVGVSFGAVLSMISIFYLASVYVPSFVSTVMSFRCGSIGSLKDPLYPVHRYALDQTTILYGAAFWGAIFTCAIVWALAGVVGFIVVWKEARSLVQSILATIIGFLITLLLKLLILQILRKSWYGAFYRRKPAAVNVMNVVLECWSLGLSSGYIIGRIVKLLLVAVFYIGRIDTPMLAPGVGWVFNRIPIDSFPIAFRKDILIHEAHRHPYIERLGMLFLLKLHNGPNFGCRACALWRILFVRALMPWLRKYRKRMIMLDNSQSYTAKKQGGFSSIDNASNRKRRAVEYENEELRRENLMLRQQLLKQTRLQRRRSAIVLDGNNAD